MGEDPGNFRGLKKHQSIRECNKSRQVYLHTQTVAVTLQSFPPDKIYIKLKLIMIHSPQSLNVTIYRYS